jgi:predicted ATPase/DNA-binding winged helix-turn-helix (wHTH) protein
VISQRVRSTRDVREEGGGIVTSSVLLPRQRYPLTAPLKPHQSIVIPIADEDQDLSVRPREANDTAVSAILFGPFRLFPTKRLLLDSDKQLHLGSRALDILIMLVERVGELTCKQELMARVWPDTIVVEDNLTVHVAALRRALKDGKDGNRYIVTVPGRGYCFVSPITHEEIAPPRRPATAISPYHLPTCLTRLIGRDDAIAKLMKYLPSHHLLTIVGPGGIGKTSLALAVAERVIPKYAHGICLVDLASLGESSRVLDAVAAALGLDERSECPLPRLIAALADKQILLILDNCEHLIGAAAELAMTLLHRLDRVQILATSREPLRIEGEHVHRLSQLESPRALAGLTAVEALVFPAVQLFVERAAARLGEFEIEDADAPIVAQICQRLDGVPLLIEFAAARVAAIGLRGVAARLGDCLRSLTCGHRTSRPRQQSFGGTLEWSYGLLSEDEKSTLQRLSVFADRFSLREAAGIAAETGRSESETIDIVLELVSKSLIVAEIIGAEPHLRLFETTRTFVRMKLDESGTLIPRLPTSPKTSKPVSQLQCPKINEPSSTGARRCEKSGLEL